MRVLLVGHACSPGMGSEPGVTWNWAHHLSAEHEVTVLAHPQYRSRVEGHLREHPNRNLKFEWVSLPERVDPWRPARGEGGLQLHYLMWLRQALRVARRLLEGTPFDVAHHVSWTTVSTAPPLWRLPIPFLWGPVGGAITAPGEFLSYFGRARAKEMVRTWRIRALPWLPGYRRAARHITMAFASNRETEAFLEKAGVRDVRRMTDFGLTAGQMANRAAERPARDTVELLWAGRLEPRKALPLALEAMAEAGERVRLRLTVAGDGPLRGEWERRARALGLADRVRFLGLVAAEEMPRRFQEADGFVFSSLRDGFGTVVLEAMANGLPVVALDHQGVGSTLPAGAAVKVPVTTRRETVAAFAEGLARLGSAQERERIGRAAREFAASQSWTERAKAMTRCYEDSIREHGLRRVPAAEARPAAGARSS